MPRDNPLQIRAIREHGRVLTGGPQDYQPLMELLGNSRFVVLGEATHGTHDFYHTLAHITKWLIEQKASRQSPLRRTGQMRTAPEEEAVVWFDFHHH